MTRKSMFIFFLVGLLFVSIPQARGVTRRVRGTDPGTGTSVAPPSANRRLRSVRPIEPPDSDGSDDSTVAKKQAEKDFVEIESLLKTKNDQNLARALTLTRQVANSLGQFKGDKTVLDMLVKNLGYQENAQERQGDYAGAADSVRASNALLPNRDNLGTVMHLTEMDETQRDCFKLYLEIHEQAKTIRSEILDLVRQKNASIQEVLSQSKISKADFEKLQALIKDLSAKVKAKEKELGDSQRKLENELDKIPGSKGIIYNPEQRGQIARIEDEIEVISSQTNTQQKAAETGLLAISEKFSWGWDGLKGKLSQMLDLHKEMVGSGSPLDKLRELMRKSPLTDADKEEIRALNKELGALQAKFDSLLADAEKGFMDAKIFAQLSPEEKREFAGTFKRLREYQKMQQEEKAKVEEFIKKMDPPPPPPPPPLVDYKALYDKMFKAMVDNALRGLPPWLRPLLKPLLENIFRPIVEEWIASIKRSVPVTANGAPGAATGTGVVGEPSVGQDPGGRSTGHVESTPTTREQPGEKPTSLGDLSGN